MISPVADVVHVAAELPTSEAAVSSVRSLIPEAESGHSFGPVLHAERVGTSNTKTANGITTVHSPQASRRRRSRLSSTPVLRSIVLRNKPLRKTQYFVP